jgi:hypothetical protein
MGLHAVVGISVSASGEVGRYRGNALFTKCDQAEKGMGERHSSFYAWRRFINIMIASEMNGGWKFVSTNNFRLI